jgi:ubiquinone/menaquinone biosynthesis C-methylase UbiE
MEFDAGEYREESRDTWGKMASGWEDRNEWMNEVTGRVNEWIAERVAPQPGQTILDVAAGPGDLGRRVAAMVGDGGRVISTDFAPEMVEIARRLGEERGPGNVEYEVMDAERMGLEDDSVDGVVCRWGYMLMADPGAALAETRRVLRDGGSLGFAVWGSPEENPWAAVPAMTLVQMGHMPPPQPGLPGIFAMADPERVRGLARGAGFDQVDVEEIRFEFAYSDFDDVWDSLIRLAGPLARAIEQLDEAGRQQVKDAIEENMSPHRNEDGSYSAPAVSLGALAR